MESDKFFSQVDTFQACLSCTFLCLFLVHCLCRDMTARLNLRYRKSVAEKGGMNTGSACAEGRKRRQAGSPLVGVRKLSACAQPEAVWFPIARNNCVLVSERIVGVGCEYLIVPGY
jgi:hypothetical protein